MPLTTLDSNAALIVIDLQKGIVGMPAAHSIGEIVGRSAELARAFRERGLPVVLVNVTGAAPGRTDQRRPNFALPPDWAELVPELEQQQSDYLVSKQRWGGFIGTEMDAILRERGVTQVFLTGVATSIGVESTARSLFDAWYNLVLVADAMTDRDAETHRCSVEKIFPRMGEVETAEGVLKILRGQDEYQGEKRSRAADSLRECQPIGNNNQNIEYEAEGRDRAADSLRESQQLGMTTKTLSTRLKDAIEQQIPFGNHNQLGMTTKTLSTRLKDATEQQIPFGNHNQLGMGSKRLRISVLVSVRKRRIL